MELIDRGVAAASQPGTDRQSCAFPGICVLPGGRWICGFRAAPRKDSVGVQSAMLTWSDDEGRRWSAPAEPFTPPVLDGRPGRFRAAYCTALGGSDVLATLYWVDVSDPSLPFFNEKTQGLLDSKIFHAISYDHGRTWDEPTLMDTHPFNQPTPITGPLLVLPDGRWVCHFELNKHYDDPVVWRHCSVLMFSSDRGKTWPEHFIASNDPTNRIFYWDQRPAVLPDGRILDVFWTYDNEAGTYLNIHARESRDLGKTWSPIRDTGVPGQPAPPVGLPDGRIGMVYVDRSAEPVIKMRASTDGGTTWPAETELRISEPQTPSQTWSKKSMEDAWAEMGKFSIGLPATTVLSNGDILVVYYAGPQTDQTDIRWARIRP